MKSTTFPNTEYRRRRGFTVAEMLVACIVLAALLAFTGKMLLALSLQRTAAAHRACALWEASNQMERLTLEPWDALTQENLATYKLSDEAARQLPDSRLQLEVTSDERPPSSKQIVLEIHWRDAHGEYVAPMRLTSWIYRVDATE